MSLLKYFSRVDPRYRDSQLPDPNGPLARAVPSSVKSAYGRGSTVYTHTYTMHETHCTCGSIERTSGRTNGTAKFIQQKLCRELSAKLRRYTVHCILVVTRSVAVASAYACISIQHCYLAALFLDYLQNQFSALRVLHDRASLTQHVYMRVTVIVLSVCVSTTELAASYLVHLLKVGCHSAFCTDLNICIVWISLKTLCSKGLVTFNDNLCLLHFLTSSRWTKVIVVAPFQKDQCVGLLIALVT